MLTKIESLQDLTTSEIQSRLDSLDDQIQAWRKANPALAKCLRCIPKVAELAEQHRKLQLELWDRLPTADELWNL